MMTRWIDRKIHIALILNYDITIYMYIYIYNILISGGITAIWHYIMYNLL